MCFEMYILLWVIQPVEVMRSVYSSNCAVLGSQGILSTRLGVTLIDKSMSNVTNKPTKGQHRYVAASLQIHCATISTVGLLNPSKLQSDRQDYFSALTRVKMKILYDPTEAG